MFFGYKVILVFASIIALVSAAGKLTHCDPLVPPNGSVVGYVVQVDVGQISDALIPHICDDTRAALENEGRNNFGGLTVDFWSCTAPAPPSNPIMAFHVTISGNDVPTQVQMMHQALTDLFSTLGGVSMDNELCLPNQ